MIVNLWNALRGSGFMLILMIYLVHQLDTAQIDLIEDINHLQSSQHLIHHSNVWSLNLTNNNGNNFLSQSTTEKILKILSTNKGFSLCVTLTQNNSTSGTIFSINYQGRIRFLEIKISVKRNVVKILYFPDWLTYGYRTEKLTFTSTNNSWVPMCIEYTSTSRELSLNFDCKTLAKVTLRESIPYKSFGDKNKYDFKVWIGQKGTTQGLFKGSLRNMIFSDNDRLSHDYCPRRAPYLSNFAKVSSLQNDGISDRITAMESELIILKQQLAETQKYLKDVQQCQCFPQCVASNGQIKSFLDTWNETPCSNCTCKLQGKVCHHQTCQSLRCTKNITDIGKCCPRCPYNCQYLKNKYPHDQGFSINCMECHCNDGTLSCRRINPEIQCPKLKCHKFLQVKPKGQCCKRCKAFNMCELTKCGPNASCKESIFGCQCEKGYQGNPYTGCSDIDECKERRPCPANNDCVNTNGSYQCLCKPGYFRMNSSSEVCQAICSKNICQNNSTCVGPDQCECKSGFMGSSCDIDIDECRLGLVKCPLHADCVNIPGGYICRCSPGYQSVTDDVLSISYDHQCIDINECWGTRGVHFHCDTSSSCKNIPGGYQCIPKKEESQPFGSNCAIQRSNGDINLLYDRNKMNIVESCKRCQCQSGILLCDGIECNCSVDGIALCCPKCSQSVCGDKQPLESSAVNSTSLNCTLSDSNCTNIRCPTVTCTDAILLPGQCCKYCQSNSLTSCIMAYNNLNYIVPGLIEYMAKCKIDGTSYKSGKNIIGERFLDKSCIKCLCWDGHVCCGKTFACTEV